MTATIQPEMVDKFGTKWYLDKGGSTYAAATLGDGATVWLIEELNGAMRICLVIDQKVVFEAATVQEVGQEIDRITAMVKAGHLRGNISRALNNHK